MPKALVTLGGTPLVVHAARRLLATGGVSHAVVVAPASHEGQFRDVLHAAGVLDERVLVVPGGAERSDSVRHGLRALDRSCDLVLVHDAARALAPSALSERVLASLATGADAVIPGMAVHDTIKVVEPRNAEDDAMPGAVGLGAYQRRADGERVVSTPPRAALRAIQTPQGFRRSVLVTVHESGADATDDAALVEVAGWDVVVIDGDVLALKITTPLDIVVAEHLLTDLTEADPA